MEIVKRLKEIGTDISVDDFGKGFSSLIYLKQFDVDALKIDSSFIKDIPEDSDDRQGYYFSWPLEGSEFQKMLIEDKKLLYSHVNVNSDI